MSMQQNVYEVGVFNARVRQALAEGESDPSLSDDWADIHYFEIRADDESVARTKMERRYPPANGYVITDVKKLR
jgi:hypothetical protein